MCGDASEAGSNQPQRIAVTQFPNDQPCRVWVLDPNMNLADDPSRGGSARLRHQAVPETRFVALTAAVGPQYNACAPREELE